MTDRHGDRHHPVAAFRDPHPGLGVAGQGEVDLMGQGGGGPVLAFGRASGHGRVGAGHGGSRRAGRGQGLAGNGLGDEIAVGYGQAVDIVQPRPLAGRNEIVA